MKLVVTPDEVARSFDELIEARETREEIAHWASILMHGLDNGTVRLSPESAEKRIQRALLFLAGVDMRVSDKEYLSSLEDCREQRRELLKS